MIPVMVVSMENTNVDKDAYKNIFEVLQNSEVGVIVILTKVEDFYKKSV